MISPQSDDNTGFLPDDFRPSFKEHGHPLFQIALYLAELTEEDRRLFFGQLPIGSIDAGLHFYHPAPIIGLHCPEGAVRQRPIGQV